MPSVHLRKEPFIRVRLVMFGNAGTGKKAFLSAWSRHYMLRYHHASHATMLANTGRTAEPLSIMVDGVQVLITADVLSDERRFRSRLPFMARGADVGLFLCDLTRRSTFDHAIEWLSVVKEKLKEGVDFLVIIIGNKVDLVELREISREEGSRIAHSVGRQGYIECSVKMGENVELVLETVARLMMERKKKE
jgi:GTPase SAR1 family protein